MPALLLTLEAEGEWERERGVEGRESDRVRCFGRRALLMWIVNI